MRENLTGLDTTCKALLVHLNIRKYTTSTFSTNTMSKSCVNEARVSDSLNLLLKRMSLNLEGNDFPPLALALPLCPLGLREMSFTATVLTE